MSSGATPAKSRRWAPRIVATILLLGCVASLGLAWYYSLWSAYRLSGDWTVVEAEVDGERATSLQGLAPRVQFSGLYSLTFLYADGGFESRQIDLRGFRPGRIRLIGWYGDVEAEAAYRWEGNRLVLWLPGFDPREPPADLSTRPNKIERRLTLERK